MRNKRLTEAQNVWLNGTGMSRLNESLNGTNGIQVATFDKMIELFSDEIKDEEAIIKKIFSKYQKYGVIYFATITDVYEDYENEAGPVAPLEIFVEISLEDARKLLLSNNTQIFKKLQKEFLNMGYDNIEDEVDYYNKEADNDRHVLMMFSLYKKIRIN